MLKALAVMLLTAAHSASANDQSESADTQTNNLEQNTEVIVDEFDYLENEATGISNEKLQELIDHEIANRFTGIGTDQE